MKNFVAGYIIATVLLFCGFDSFAQQYWIKGKVTDESGEALIGANILLSDGSGAVTDIEGAFAILHSEGDITITFSYIGYQSLEKSFYLKNDTLLNVVLAEGVQIDEVIVTAKAVKSTASLGTNGNITLSASALEKIPSMLGERELMKGLQLLPGVQSGNEGARGIFVRGGGPDQNLVLYEGAPVYNVAHLYGIFSVFNSDVLKEAELYKNYIPARMGGRLASALDIKTDPGNFEKWKGSFSIGIFTSKLMVEGPLVKDKLSLKVALRGCYAGLFSGPLSEKQFESASESGRLTYNFYDVNISLNAKINDKQTLSYHFFNTDDKYQLMNEWRSSRTTSIGKTNNLRYTDTKDYLLRWRNMANAVQWNFQIKDNWSVQNAVSNSRYSLISDDRAYVRYQGADTALYKYWETQLNEAGINDVTFTNTFHYKQNYHSIYFGSSVGYRVFNTGTGFVGEIRENGKSESKNYGSGKIPTLESAFFADYLFRKNRWLIEAGLRPVVYSDLNNYTFFDFQPRFLTEFSLKKDVVIQLSMMRTTQNLHLLTSSAGSILNDFWVPATGNIPTEKAWQFGAGFRQQLQKGFEWSADVFYRNISGLIEYAEGSSYVLFGSNWENQIASGGKGRAYGMELFAAKTKGKFTAWTKYTLSRTERLFGQLNRGNWFPAKYDRTHDFSTTLNYKLNQKFDFTLSWVYGTGNTFTLPSAQYGAISIVDQYTYWNDNDIQNSDPQSIQFFEGRNNYRLKAYHHLDFGMNYRKEALRVKHLFNFSIYNIYNRLNVFNVYVDYEEDENGGGSRVYKTLSLFPALPSVSYTLTIK